MWFLEHGKGNYWTGDKMVEHAIRIALLTPRMLFPAVRLSFHSTIPQTTSLSLKISWPRTK